MKKEKRHQHKVTSLTSSEAITSKSINSERSENFRKLSKDIPSVILILLKSEVLLKCFDVLSHTKQKEEDFLSSSLYRNFRFGFVFLRELNPVGFCCFKGN